MRLAESWSRFFHLHEIASSKSLRAIYWVLIFGLFLSFYDWMGARQITIEAALNGGHICPPYFRNCGDWYFFDSWPEGFGEPLFYALLAGTVAISALGAITERWWLAHIFLIPSALWKLVYLVWMTYEAQVDYEYFSVPILFGWLLFARKEYFLRRTFVCAYLLAATAKFSSSWLGGEYFTSLTSGLPLFPMSTVPMVTLGVTVFEIFSPWLLLSSKRSLRYPTVALWSLFHLYSVIIVNLRYPSVCLPILWCLFLPDVTLHELKPSFRRVDWVGWAMIAALLVVASVPFLIEQNRPYSLFAKKFGVTMFIANYQCESRITTEDAVGETTIQFIRNTAAMRRCEPYKLWFGIHQQCLIYGPRKIAWQMATSVNGGPFYEIVNEKDACALRFPAFSNVPWIKRPDLDAPVVGYPQRNSLLKGNVREPGQIIFPTATIQLTPVQEIFRAHLPFLIRMCWTLWFSIALGFMIRRLRLTYNFRSVPS